MLLLHALGESAADWEDVAPAFAGGWRVHAPDLRGHGHSDWPGAYSLELMCADVAGLLDVLGLGRVDLIGHSMGGAVALLLAAQHPHRIDSPDPAWLHQLDRITAPALIIGGGPHSHIPQDRVAELAQRIPGARLVTIPAGHLIHRAEPALFSQTVLTFLRSPSQPSPQDLARASRRSGLPCRLLARLSGSAQE